MKIGLKHDGDLCRRAGRLRIEIVCSDTLPASGSWLTVAASHLGYFWSVSYDRDAVLRRNTEGRLFSSRSRTPTFEQPEQRECKIEN